MADRDLVLELGSFQEVLDACASRVSEEELFLEIDQSLPVGSQVAFEVRIRDSFSVLRGDGEIVQVTGDGLYIRMAYLDQPSRRLLPTLLDHYRRHGISLLELPEIETPAAVEVPEAIEVVEEPPAELTADDLFSEPEKIESATPSGLTLDDLEAEFMDSKAIEASPTDDDESAAAELLIDPEELIADTPVNQEVFAPDDIRLNPLISAEEAAGLKVDEVSELVDPVSEVPEIERQEPQETELEELESMDPEPELPEPEETEPEESEIGYQVDAGLPWLPDEETEVRGRKDRWIILILILLGAILGVAFYYFFLRPEPDTSQGPVEPVEIQAQAVPASSPIVESISLPAATPQPEPEARRPAALPTDREAEPRQADVMALSTDPVTGVDRITWDNESGETVVTFWGDGLFSAAQVDDFRVAGGEPREVVRIRGVDRPFVPQQIELDTAHVRRIRVGLHEETEGAALHFVADLVDGDVEILRTEAAGEQLRVYFAKTG